MTHFSDPAHLTPGPGSEGVKVCPPAARKAPAARSRRPIPARVLGKAAVSIGKTDTFLGKRYRRIARRRGKKKAIVAVGCTILTIIWHMMSDRETQFADLGSGFYDSRINPERKKRNQIRRLEPSVTKSPCNPQPDPPKHSTSPVPQPNRPRRPRRQPICCPVT